MKLLLKWLPWIIGASAGGAVLIALGFAISRIQFTGGPTIIQGTRPISIREARKAFPPGVPDSAQNIHYAKYAEYVAFAEFIKFDAPVDECITHARKLLAQYNSEHPNSNVQGLRPFKSFEGSVEIPAPLQLPWFDPTSISNGQVGGKLGSHQPLIWIDTEKGVFYYQCQD